MSTKNIIYSILETIHGSSEWLFTMHRDAEFLQEFAAAKECFDINQPTNVPYIEHAQDHNICFWAWVEWIWEFETAIFKVILFVVLLVALVIVCAFAHYHCPCCF